MGKIFSKTSSRNKYAQLIEETNLRSILEHEHEEIMQENHTDSVSLSMTTKNRIKNRYQNTPCFNYNRVILTTENSQDNYINASHVDGHKAKGRFICTQAPLKGTAHDFWRMVWAYQSQVIVMLMKIIEEERETYYQYWSPFERSAVVYGMFSIKTRKIKVYRHHIITNLQITNGTGAVLDVEHFAYTDWPQNDVPQDPANFLSFVLAVRKAQAAVDSQVSSDDDKQYPPMVVHCSAGLNRTGTFCLIDICISKYDENATISLSSVLRNLRKQRYNCLASCKQYVFCYLILLHYVKKAT